MVKNYKIKINLFLILVLYITQAHSMRLGEFKFELKPFNNGELIEVKYNQALELIAEGNTDKAIEVLTDVLSAKPQHKAARLQLALLLKNHDERALERLLKEGVNKFNDLEITKALAIFLSNKGRYQEVIELLQTASKETKQNNIIQEILAFAYLSQNMYAIALKYYTGLSLQKQNERYLLGYALCKEKLGDLAEAYSAYSKVTQFASAANSILEFAESRMALISYGTDKKSKNR